MSYIRIKNPSTLLQEAIAKRQGISIEYIKRNLRNPCGDRIYLHPTRRGPDVVMLGFI